MNLELSCIRVAVLITSSLLLGGATTARRANIGLFATVGANFGVNLVMSVSSLDLSI